MAARVDWNEAISVVVTLNDGSLARTGWDFV